MLYRMSYMRVSTPGLSTPSGRTRMLAGYDPCNLTVIALTDAMSRSSHAPEQSNGLHAARELEGTRVVRTEDGCKESDLNRRPSEYESDAQTN